MSADDQFPEQPSSEDEESEEVYEPGGDEGQEPPGGDQADVPPLLPPTGEAGEYEVSGADLAVGYAPEEGPAPGAGGRASAFGTLVLVVAFLAAGAAAAKFYWDLSAANRALTSTATTLASLAGAPAQRALLDEVVGHVNGHRYEKVARGLQELAGGVASSRRPGAGRGPGAGLQGPRAGGPGAEGDDELVQVPPQAEQFFRTRPQLFQRVMGLVEAARQLREKGADVGELRTIRDEIIAAAAAGDEPKVVQLMRRFEEQVRASGGQVPGRQGRRGAREGPGGGRQMPQALQKKGEQLKQALERATRQGRDVRAALLIAKRAEEAMMRGDLAQAEDLADKALRAIAHAPRRQQAGRARRPGAARARPGVGAAPNPLRVLEVLFDMVRSEDTDLAAAYDSMENAGLALREKNQDQIRELLSFGKESLERIAKRREKVAQAIQPPQARQGERRPRPGRPGAPGGPGTGPVPPGAGVEDPSKLPLPQRLVSFLKHVREMPEEAFEANKQRLAAIVFSMFMPPEPEGKKGEVDEAAVERVKQKLRLASGPFAQRQMAGEDLSDVEELFRMAREALYNGRTAEAEDYTDEALKLLGLLETPEEAGPEKPATPVPSGPSGQEAAKARRAPQAVTPAPEAQPRQTQPAVGTSVPQGD